MVKRQYTSPEFRFKELFLFEGVADVCWGYHEADLTLFYDADRDDALDPGEVVIYTHHFVPSEGGHGQGCANVEVAISGAMAEIEQAFIKAGYGKYWNDDVRNTILTHENAGDSSHVYIPIHS